MNRPVPASSATSRAAAMRSAWASIDRRADGSSGSPSSMLMPTAPASSTASIVWATSSGLAPKPLPMSALTGTSTASPTRTTTASALARSRWPPSAVPMLQATPALVVATAGAPADSTRRALRASHTLGSTSGLPRRCSERNRSALSDRVVMATITARPSPESRLPRHLRADADRLDRAPAHRCAGRETDRKQAKSSGDADDPQVQTGWHRRQRRLRRTDAHPHQRRDRDDGADRSRDEDHDQRLRPHHAPDLTSAGADQLEKRELSLTF